MQILWQKLLEIDCQIFRLYTASNLQLCAAVIFSQIQEKQAAKQVVIISRIPEICDLNLGEQNQSRTKSTKFKGAKIFLINPFICYVCSNFSNYNVGNSFNYRKIEAA